MLWSFFRSETTSLLLLVCKPFSIIVVRQTVKFLGLYTCPVNMALKNNFDFRPRQGHLSSTYNKTGYRACTCVVDFSAYVCTFRVTWLGEFSPIGYVIVYFSQLFENYRSSTYFGPLFGTVKVAHKLWQKLGWATFWAIFCKHIGSPCVHTSHFKIIAI
jgi:hypothetical protein